VALDPTAHFVYEETMKAKLIAQSYHSVKGGVGRSALANRAAVMLAAEVPGRSVYVIDTDFFGTSRADSGSLRAPRWSASDTVRPATLLAAPDSFYSPEETTRRVTLRHQTRRGLKDDIVVPFLDDYILFQTKDWDKDVHVSAIAWHAAGSSPNLRVIPSSALPNDLRWMEPIVADERHAAFIESRMEHLLAAILELHPGRETCVVFDCPRGFHGVSHAILSIGLRLSEKPMQHLSDDGGTPLALVDADVNWKIRVVVGEDTADRAAVARWSELAENDAIEVVDSYRKGAS
jgi:hypothetical protein